MSADGKETNHRGGLLGLYPTELIRIAAALILLWTLTGCTTTSRPIAQAGSAKSKNYVSEDTPTTGSHITRRYAVDDPNRPADKTSSDSTNILVDPTLAGPIPAWLGRKRD